MSPENEDSIEEFASSLTELEQDSSRIIIRGQLKDDVAIGEWERSWLY